MSQNAEDSTGMVKRLSVNVASEVDAFVHLAAREDGMTVTAQVIRAIRVYQVVRETVRSGGTVLLKDRSGKVKEIVLL